MPRPRHDTVGRISMVAIVFAFYCIFHPDNPACLAHCKSTSKLWLLLTKTCRPQQALVSPDVMMANNKHDSLAPLYGISNVVRTNRNLFLFIATTGTSRYEVNMVPAVAVSSHYTLHWALDPRSYVANRVPRHYLPIVDGSEQRAQGHLG
jgi:hypothetical protein